MNPVSKSTATLLCLLPPAVGLFGLHRIRIGRKLSGYLMLVLGLVAVAGLVVLGMATIPFLFMVASEGGDIAGALADPSLALVAVSAIVFLVLELWILIDFILIVSGNLPDGAGNPLYVGPPDQEQPYAGFWVRSAAMIVDGFIISLISVAAMTALNIVSLLVIVPMAANGTVDESLFVNLQMAINALALLIGLLYFAISTSSTAQGTIGKRCFRIYVANTANERIGFLRAAWRCLCYILSAAPLMIGYVIAAFTGRKRALHDYLATTVVMYRDASTEVLRNPAAMQARPVASARRRAPTGASQHPTAAPAGTGGALAMLGLGGALLIAAAYLALLG